MGIEMSEQFREAVKKAALTLDETNPKAYLENPFGGFFVSFEAQGEVFATFKSLDLLGKEGENIVVICESFLGKKASQ